MDDEGKINRNDFLEGMARIIAVRHSFVLYLLLPTYIYMLQSQPYDFSA